MYMTLMPQAGDCVAVVGSAFYSHFFAFRAMAVSHSAEHQRAFLTGVLRCIRL